MPVFAFVIVGIIFVILLVGIGIMYFYNKRKQKQMMYSEISYLTEEPETTETIDEPETIEYEPEIDEPVEEKEDESKIIETVQPEIKTDEEPTEEDFYENESKRCGYCPDLISDISNCGNQHKIIKRQKPNENESCWCEGASCVNAPDSRLGVYALPSDRNKRFIMDKQCVDCEYSLVNCPDGILSHELRFWKTDGRPRKRGEDCWCPGQTKCLPYRPPPKIIPPSLRRPELTTVYQIGRQRSQESFCGTCSLNGGNRSIGYY